jgi:hypothetical protein
MLRANFGAWLEDAGETLAGFSGVRVPLGLGPVDVGRDRGCGVHLDHPYASRVHARLERGSDGNWRVRDHGSSSGTFVDDTRADDRELADGAVLRMGQARLRFREGEVDDVVGACFAIGGRLLFARTWPSASHFASVVVDETSGAVVRGASLVPDSHSRFARTVLHREGLWALVEDLDADGPTLREIARATKAHGAQLDPEVLGAVVAGLSEYANELHEVVVSWDGDVRVLGLPEIRTQMMQRDWFAQRIRDHGYVVEHWYRRPPAAAAADKAMLAGLVQRLFPDEARRARELREQIAMRGDEAWRSSIAKWSIR